VVEKQRNNKCFIHNLESFIFSTTQNDELSFEFGRHKKTHVTSSSAK
jgi:hypothetical protein